MKIRAIEISQIFTPEFNGNKDLPAGEQVKIHFSRIPSTVEKSNYVNIKMDQKSNYALEYNDQMLIPAFVERIDNLEIGDKKITNGKELAAVNNSLLEPLITEIRTHLFPQNEKLEPGELKT